MRTPFSLMIEATGEHLWAIDETRISMAERAPAQGGAGVAVIPLQGALAPKAVSFFGRVLAPGMDSFRAQLAQAAANPDVAAIILDVNSPGGTYAGTPETAAAVRAAAAVKSVTAVVDTLCASAAYFIASQAHQVVATPSGEVGSIGVVAVHEEMSKLMEDIGVRATIFRSRASKADINSLEPLSDSARAALQALVLEADDDFLKAVAKGRGMTAAQVRKLVDDNELGRTVSAQKALSLGLIDRVATLGEVLAGMVKPRAIPRRRSALAFL